MSIGIFPRVDEFCHRIVRVGPWLCEIPVEAQCAFKRFKSIRTPNPRDHVELPVREVPTFLESFIRFFLNFHLHSKDIVAILCIPLVYAYRSSVCSLLHLADNNFPSDSYITALLSLSCIGMFTCPTLTASHSSEGRTGIDTYSLSFYHLRRQHDLRPYSKGHCCRSTILPVHP